MRAFTNTSGMSIKSIVFRCLPEKIQPAIKRGYYKITGRRTLDEHRSQFITEFYDSKSEYDRYCEEFDEGGMRDIRDKAIQKYNQLTGEECLSGIGLEVARDWYAITRSIKPENVIETGVCNGISTMAILLAMEENEIGTLYSIDYPFRADESLDEFRSETFDSYGGAAIPADKDPGWVIPEELRARWDLTIGKSQRKLPGIIQTVDSFDMFIHDSEHSFPCMMFEYELAHEWVEDGGVILSDDIGWNEAFSVFTSVRNPSWGKLSNNVGYIIKEG
jgi:hypothetical protein